MHNQTVGICVTTFNNEKIIVENILTILKQDTTTPLKVFIVDDGSTDRTGELLTELAKDWSNLHVVLAEHRERGVTRSHAINLAIDDKCEYILFIDSDMKLESNLVSECLKMFNSEKLSALIIPESPYSEHKNFMTKVKIFERSLINDVGEEIEKNSIEGARFWKTSEYLRSGGLNSQQIAFEETQPTIRILEKGGVIKRAVKTKLYHDEGLVTLKNIIEKKNYYFSKMKTTTETEKGGLMKAIQRWYFFRPYLYSKQNIIKYLMNPVKFAGLMTMYVALTLIAVRASVLSK